MSPPGRPKGEAHRSAQREATPMSRPTRLDREGALRSTPRPPGAFRTPDMPTQKNLRAPGSASEASTLGDQP
jgi:hypothetical protein